jgi:UDP-glucuronate decarboxylase
MMQTYLEEDIKQIVEGLEGIAVKLSDSTVLLTGASGFLGKYFMAVLSGIRKKYPESKLRVIAIDNYTTSKREDIAQGDIGDHVEWIYADAKIASELPDKFDYIIHAAGIASPQHYRARPLETIYVAVDVTRSLLERAKKDNARFLFFSSSEIYGDPISNEVPTKETYRGNVTSRGPRACYDESKRLGETLCWVYSENYGVHASVVRPFNVYGPGMMPTDYRVLPNFAWSVASGKEITIYGDGKQTRTFCYITDAIIGFLKVLVNSEQPEVFNVGNPSPEISINDLVKVIGNVLNIEPLISHVNYPDSYPADEPMRRCPDINKIQTLLNYAPSVNLEEGLKRFFRWSEMYYKQFK